MRHDFGMDDDIINNVILSAALVATFLGIGLIAAGNIFAFIPFLIGILGFVYLKTGFNRTKESSSSDVNAYQEEALTLLRHRYARGEIDQAEFERRLDGLLETETIEQAESYHEKSLTAERSQ